MITIVVVLALGAMTGVAAYTYRFYKKYSKNKFAAMDQSEFNSILKKTNLKTKYENGQILCSISGKIITFENLGYIDMRSDGQMIFISRESLPLAAQTPLGELKQVVA